MVLGGGGGSAIRDALLNFWEVYKEKNDTKGVRGRGGVAICQKLREQWPEQKGSKSI
jgi:hypothetical protein